MIRINLLEVRPQSTEGLDSILSSGRSSTFISRREALVGVLFLALTVGILGVLALQTTVEDEAAESPVLTTESAHPAVVNQVPAAPVPAPQPETPAVVEQPPAPPVENRREEPPPPAPPPAPQPAVTPAVTPPSGSAGGAITAVTATALTGRVDVFLELPDPPAVKRFRVDAPPRLVFDIPGVQLRAPNTQRLQEVDAPLVRRLRIAQFSQNPPVVRLVLETGEAPADAAVSAGPAGLSIRVTPAP